MFTTIQKDFLYCKPVTLSYIMKSYPLRFNGQKEK